MAKISYRTVNTTKTEIYTGNLRENIQEQKKKLFVQKPKIHFVFDSGLPENVRIYAEEAFLNAISGSYEVYFLPSGEEAKKAETVLGLARSIIMQGVKRNDLLVVVGGGAVCDAGNFTASILLRGIKSILIPTTLLSMVDASIGGKTAVNVNGIKNQIGTFHQPSMIFIDPFFLKTLPEKELKSGFGEIIKTLLLAGEEKLILRKNLSLDDTKIIEKCVRYKARIVKQDPYEKKGKREFLNFGHTIGHALEAAAMGEIPHGIAVAISLYWEQKLAEMMILSEKEIHLSKRIGEILELNGYDRFVIKNYDIFPYFKFDKKIKEEDFIRFVYLKEKGKPAVGSIRRSDFEAALKDLIWNRQ